MNRRLFITIDFPPEKGGIQNYAYGLVSNLVPEEVCVLTSNHIKKEESDLFDDNQLFKIYRIQMLSNKSTFFKLILMFKLILHIIFIMKKHQINELHFVNVFPIGLVAPIIKFFRRVPYAVYIHGLDVLSLKNSKISYSLLQFILRNANKVICNSNYTKNIILNMGIRENNTAILHPGIDIPNNTIKDKNTLKEQLGLKDKRVLLTVSRLVERKGHDKVLLAMKQLINIYPNIVYIIVGDGPDKDRLTNLVKEYGVENYVLFKSNLENNEIYDLYQVADLFVMPSREIKNKGDVEGYGIVFLEANYFHLPVIAGNSGGIPDAVKDGETGYLVDPINVEEIIQKIGVVFNDEELMQSMGKLGHKWAVENCLWKHRVITLNKMKMD